MCPHHGKWRSISLISPGGNAPFKMQVIKHLVTGLVLLVGFYFSCLYSFIFSPVLKKTCRAAATFINSRPGGQASSNQHILKSPPRARQSGRVSGQLVIHFTEDKDGSIAGPKVLKSVSPTVDVACIRLVNSMPNWITGV